MTTRLAPASLLLVGNPDPVHVGAHLVGAARALGIQVDLCDVRDAYAAPPWRRRLDWWLRGRRPSRLRGFGEHVVHAALSAGVRCVLSTGIAPLDRQALEALGRAGMKRINFLTDDPWNRAHRAPWFLRALGHYDRVFTPRHANVPDLEALDGPLVSYLPFAYSPAIHFPEPPVTRADRERFRSDLVFIGGADADRLRAVAPFIAAGLDVALYGGYWHRHEPTRAHARGLLGPDELRKAIGGAAIALCLVRRANRDGHAMRSFEVAAMGGCMLVEDTAEHRAMFGADGDAVVYFGTPDEAVRRARALLAHPQRRATLAARARELMERGHHTYADRLTQMLASEHQAVA